MTAAETGLRTLIEDLARGESGRLLREELAHRWPETDDKLTSITRYALLPAGKMLRPIMAVYAAQAVGGRAADVLPAALAMEYLHVATLVHDDIIDADTMRRGRPTVAVAFGVPDAVVTGDHLIFRAFCGLVDEPSTAPPENIVAAVRALADAGRDLCRGQMLESQLVGDIDAGARWYAEMIRLKTGALFRAVCHIGALLGGAEPEVAESLARYGAHVGMAFQIRDDVLSYVGTPEQTGKAATSDLNNGRPTLPILLAYDAATEAQRKDLVTVLHNRGAGDGDTPWVIALIDELGAVAGARAQMTALAQQAEAELAVLAPSESVDVLTAIARWTTSEQS
jgi:geranylgeranyl diphosphate synthase type I